MDIRHLNAFIAVAEEGSFRSAAKRLYTAQPALSRTIQALEQELGVMLFRRTTRRVELTEPGRHLLDKARQIIKDIDDAIEGTQRIDRGEMGELHIGFNDFAISDQLPAIIQNFRSLHPEIKLNLVSSTSDDMIEMVLDKRLDIAFTSGVTPPEGANHFLTRSEQLVCVASKHHPLASKKSVSLKELANEGFVMGDKDWGSYLSIVNDFCQTAGFTPNVVQQAIHSDGIINLIAAGVGITIYVDKPWLHKRNDIAVLNITDPQPAYESIAVWRKNGSSNRLNYFLDALRSITEKGPEH